MNSIRPIKRALLSVFDKTGLAELAAFLIEHDILIISTGGTARHLQENGLTFTDVSHVTQFPEILDGRVKTLNPRIHAGILFDRDNKDHGQTLTSFDIAPIDLVVANLYPFATIAQKANASEQELLEHIDIGGPAMLRAAAKNHPHVCVLSSPKDYSEFLAHYRENGGTTAWFRSKSAALAYTLTSAYDAAIAETFRSRYIAPKIALRYGENPHQKAKLIIKSTSLDTVNLAVTTPLSGRQLSYNNMLDAHAAILALRSLCDQQENHRATAIVIKHGIPCGAARNDDPARAIALAITSDEESAFGGILACNFSFDLACAQRLNERFLEIVIAVSFSKDAQDLLALKKNLRLIALPNLMSGKIDAKSQRSILGGTLEQDTDHQMTNPRSWQCVTKIAPTFDEQEALETAFRLVIPTPSNAITVATADHLLGVGAGQPKRIQACQIAIDGACARGFDLTKAALASDAFLPFTDCLEYAHAHGIRLIIQPGGSIKDGEVIKRADELNLSMLFTGTRHFRH